jgi:hypothetical protein
MAIETLDVNTQMKDDKTLKDDKKLLVNKNAKAQSSPPPANPLKNTAVRPVQAFCISACFCETKGTF